MDGNHQFYNPQYLNLHYDIRRLIVLSNLLNFLVFNDLHDFIRYVKHFYILSQHPQFIHHQFQIINHCLCLHATNHHLVILNLI
jgi:hypothetical protein